MTLVDMKAVEERADGRGCPAGDREGHDLVARRETGVASSLRSQGVQFAAMFNSIVVSNDANRRVSLVNPLLRPGQDGPVDSLEIGAQNWGNGIRRDNIGLAVVVFQLFLCQLSHFTHLGARAVCRELEKVVTKLIYLPVEVVQCEVGSIGRFEDEELGESNHVSRMRSLKLLLVRDPGNNPPVHVKVVEGDGLERETT
ncbi:hypothetical protein BDK51DRAFT_32466 [Blyttiomyces helicus]|uniref:Uncharacterized protein n=1 Tax=Blyttiomyces helicus TaxID=388810 RepID=A0A4P9VZU7_9FUNG|nr:hypothetical protein BDK51DRAFT_32466 [Blyttiomyces helicus]|eukprot:RKO84555.1 hypothetical protein BDK51DRAFT_32466 [Blyttiomyces helicus]